MKKYNGKLTLKNNFHHTEATVIVKDGRISERAMKRAEKKLCGMDDCLCGEIRGPQFGRDGSPVNVERGWDYDGEYGIVYECHD